MDTNDFIKLTIQAADSALSFRAVAFTPRAFISREAIATTITASILSLAKDKGFPLHIPLSRMMEFAGTAAFRTAKQWNNKPTSQKKNHIGADWFRCSVATLVGGVASEMAVNAYDPFNPRDEYLDPTGGKGSDIWYSELPTPRTPPSSTRSSSTMSASGSEPAAAANHDGSNGVQGWQSANKPAARPAESAATTITTTTTAASSRKRPRLDQIEEEVEGHEQTGKEGEKVPAETESDDEDPRPVAKIRRDCEDTPLFYAATRSSPASASVSPGTRRGAKIASAKAGDRARQGNSGMLWSSEDEQTLLRLRKEGKTWSQMPKILNRSQMACRKKYFDLTQAEGNKG